MKGVAIINSLIKEALLCKYKVWINKVVEILYVNLQAYTGGV